MTISPDLARELGLKPASALEPLVETPETRRAEAAMAPPAPRPELDFVVIDVETACSRVSSICQIGIVGFAGGREVLSYETLVDPQDSFSGFNVRLHGIGPERVAGQPTFPRLYGALIDHLGGRVTVAHSNFDQGALGAACRVAGLPAIQTRWLDSVQVARHAWPELPTHKLNALAAHLSLEHRHHDALSDARVAGWVVVRAMEQTGLSLAELLTAPWRGAPRGGRRARPAATGPLRGEQIVIVSGAADPHLAAAIAAAGGQVVSSVGRATTLVVVAGRRPFSYTARSSTPFLRAEALAADGYAIGIVSGEELRDRIAAAQA